MLYTLLVVLLLLALLGALPLWPWAVGWGAYPAGGLGLLLVVVLVILLLRGVP